MGHSMESNARNRPDKSQFSGSMPGLSLQMEFALIELFLYPIPTGL